VERGRVVPLQSALFYLFIEMRGRISDIRELNLTEANVHDLERYSTALLAITIQLEEPQRPENYPALIDSAREYGVVLPGWMYTYYQEPE
jgi:hypothetical protein